jgi:hypothetical protein
MSKKREAFVYADISKRAKAFIDKEAKKEGSIKKLILAMLVQRGYKLGIDDH